MNYVPKIHFGTSLDYVSAHSFLNFMHNNQKRDTNYVRSNLNLEGVNFKQMVKNSLNSHLVEIGKPVVTSFGIPLL